MKCVKCGQTAEELILLAMMEDAGARSSPRPTVCPADGGEHDFSDPKEATR